MKYPDGSAMKQGDLIWWNEGGCVGHVQKIIETPEEWAEWGWQGPAAYFGNLHPYDPNIIGVGYPAGCFEDEGIAKLSEFEHSALEPVRQFCIMAIMCHGSG